MDTARRLHLEAVSLLAILGRLLADGWTRELRENYPQLTDEALRAALAFAADTLHDQTLLTIRPGAA